MPELLTQREADGDIIVYVTNNSRWHRTEYQARLDGMGAPATARAHPDLAPAARPWPWPRCRSRHA